MVGAQIRMMEGQQTRACFIGTTVEETLEMPGIALFIRAILAHGERQGRAGEPARAARGPPQ